MVEGFLFKIGRKILDKVLKHTIYFKKNFFTTKNPAL